jgi:hypothetical protein
MPGSDARARATNKDAATRSEASASRHRSPGIGDFLIARGGPYYDLQQQLGLLREGALHAGRRAVIVVGLAWGVPLVLSAIAGHAIGPFAARPFLLDLGAWARFFIAIAIFVLMERLVEERLRVHLRQFTRAPLLAPGAIPAAAEAVVRALRRRDTWPAELACLVAAYAITLSGVAIALAGDSSSWLVTVAADGTRLTVAGWWCALVSSPLFWFLLLRWLWRQAVWGMLLRDLARLELRLVATHPDGAGGLAFIGQYPNAFTALVFAMSCALGAAIARTLLHGEMAVATYGQLMAAWLVVVVILFGAPLLAFTRPLRQLKETTILAASSLATRRERAAERELLGSNMSAAGDAEATASGDIPDPSKLYAAAKKLSIFLISRAAIVPVAAAALLPLVAAGATQLPIRELLKIARSLLLL